MERKDPRCSTGHGTGVTPPVSLAKILEREKVRLALKRGLRTSSVSKIHAEQANARQLFLASKERKQMLRFVGVRFSEDEAA
jgi:hypothetical protein